MTYSGRLFVGALTLTLGACASGSSSPSGHGSGPPAVDPTSQREAARAETEAQGSRWLPSAEHGAEIAPGLRVGWEVVPRGVWRAALGGDPSFGAPEAEGAVERVTFAEAAAFMNLLSRREGLPECYAVRCEAEGGIEAAMAAGATCSRGEAYCLDPQACEVTIRGGRCGFRLPISAEWELLREARARGEGEAVFGRVAEWVWPEGVAEVRGDTMVPVLGASWATSHGEHAMRKAPVRASMRSFNVGLRVVRAFGD